MRARGCCKHHEYGSGHGRAGGDAGGGLQPGRERSEKGAWKSAGIPGDFPESFAGSGDKRNFPALDTGRTDLSNDDPGGDCLSLRGDGNQVY